MKVKDVLVKYNKIVPFPWTVKKIEKAGIVPGRLFVEIGRELEKCEDIEDPTTKELLRTLTELGLLI